MWWCPAAEGEFGVLAGHAPLIAMLRPGILKILGREERQIVVGGGFAEVDPEGLTVLAELAVAIEDFDLAQVATQIRDTEEDVADATDEALRDKLRQRLEQLRELEAAVTHIQSKGRLGGR